MLRKKARSQDKEIIKSESFRNSQESFLKNISE